MICIHKWEKWKEESKANQIDDNGNIIGFVYIQKRTCVKCGKTKRHKQVIR